MTNNPTQLPFDPIIEARRQWERHGWPEPEPMAAITSIMRVQQILITQIERVLRPFELTFARYEALVLLHFSRTGALPLGKIGARLQVHPTSVTNIIDRLETQGLVQRVPHERDGRTTLAQLTPEGRGLVTRATDAVTRDAFASLPLSSDETSQLFDILRRMRMRSGDFADADETSGHGAIADARGTTGSDGTTGKVDAIEQSDTSEAGASHDGDAVGHTGVVA